MISLQKPRWDRIGLMLALWAFAGTVLSLEFAFTLSVMEAQVPFEEIALPQYQRAALWIVLAPLILHLGRRIPLGSGRYWGGILFHLLCSLGIMVLYYGARLAYVIHTQGLEGNSGAWEMAVKNFWGRNLVDMAYYWCVLGGGYYYELRRRLREKELSAALLETRLVQAELSVLRGQLHPHFLFNTLNTISVMVREGRGPEAVSLLARLASLLRMSLDTDRSPLMPLRQEMEFLSAYMEIQQARFSDRLRYRTEVAPELMSIEVPSLILQPLVENAVLHGVSHKEGPGVVSVSAQAKHGRLFLRIEDDGPGFPPEGQRGREGIGLRNTRERLAKLYGNEARLEIKSQPGQGSVVSLELPIKP